MSVAPLGRWKVWAALSAALVGLTLPTLAATPASATTTAYDATYYKNAVGKTGTSLKSSLHTIISSQSKISYDAVWNALKVTDQDPNNTANVILLYSGTSRSKTLNGGAVGNWNREHVWAQSHGNFGTSAGPGTDLHHLRAADVQVNSIRGNKDFDNGGSAVSGAPGSYTDSDSFEPRDADKGDVARMILYMAVRYEGDDAWADLEPNESTANGSVPFMGRLSVLKQWNEQDPPSAFEERRNDVIYNSYQGNRNPFVDHPEWVEAIW
ncbi:endonuclease [Streptomyces sp. NPDC094032]|uniref:endonuclease I family protein n=1 Tax=Streptomyces sp. NPDC094032 TaxID=3155308 RepID=UPI0033171EB5